MNIFLILTGIPLKSCKRSFLLHWKNSEKGHYVLDPHAKGNASIEKISSCGPSNFYHLLKVQIKIGRYGRVSHLGGLASNINGV